MPRDFQDLVTIRERAARRSMPGTGWTPPVDVYETPSGYVLVAELPGFGPGDFAVNAAVSSLTLSGKRPPLDLQAEQYLRLERGQGEFSRTFTFAEPIDPTGISAEFTRGLLTISIPKSRGPAARRIEIG